MSAVRITLISVPYDLGRAEVGSGRGPAAYLKAGAAEALQARGHEVDVVTARRDGEYENELQAVLAVNDAVAGEVAAARARGSLPLVLAGNCNAALGVRAGLQRRGGADAAAALVWLDAHGDFNTPSTTETGYLDGMPLAMLCGRAYREAVSEALGSTPVAEPAVLHIGARELDRGEAASLAASGVLVVNGAQLGDGDRARLLGERLDELAARTAPDADGRATAHLHVDLDVLDPAAAPGVSFPTPGGFTAAQLLEIVELVMARFEIVAVTVTSFTPDRDDTAESTLATGLAVLGLVAGGAHAGAPAARR